MNEEPLAANLAYACSLFPSVAEVCRRLQINRQQFNKYLSGQVRPSKHNMRLICDFLGVTEGELLLGEDCFADLISVRRKPPACPQLSGPMGHVGTLYRHSLSLERYVGYYFRYFYAFGYPGKIFKSIAVIRERDRQYFWKNIEFTPGEMLAQERAVSKYEGAAFFLGERIYIVEYETLSVSSITQLMLYPNYNTSINYLTGIQTGGSTKRGRKPAASLVLLEYIGRQIDLRRSFRQCGMFDERAIDERIRRMIQNHIPKGAYVFEAEQV